VNRPEQHELFESRVNEHGAILHHVANGFAEGADRQDLMQELLLAVWKAVPAFCNNSPPSTFIYRVSHNAALTWMRGSRNYQNRLDRYQRKPEAEFSPGLEKSNVALLERLYAEIHQLPPLDRRSSWRRLMALVTTTLPKSMVSARATWGCDSAAPDNNSPKLRKEPSMSFACSHSALRGP